MLKSRDVWLEFTCILYAFQNMFGSLVGICNVIIFPYCMLERFMDTDLMGSSFPKYNT